MLKFLMACIASLFCSAHCIAQLQDVSETLVKKSTGWYDEVTNLSNDSIVALHASFPCPASPEKPKGQTGGFESDALANYSHDRPIPPGGSSSFQLQPWATDCPGGVDAIIFADGHTEGTASILTFMYNKRLGVYEALSYAVKLVDTVAAGQADPKSVASALKSRMPGISQNMQVSVAERLGEGYGLSVVAFALETQVDLLVPSDTTPNHQPRINTVMKERGIPRQQADAIVIGNKLREWIAALQGHTVAPQNTGEE